MQIQVSHAARSQISEIIKTNELGAGYGVRLGVSRIDGKIDLSLDIEEGPDTRDRSWNVSGLAVFIDPRSYLYLKGDVDIDFSASEGGFVVRASGQ